MAIFSVKTKNALKSWQVSNLFGKFPHSPNLHVCKISESIVLYKGPYEQSSFLAVETILRNIDYFSLRAFQIVLGFLQGMICIWLHVSGPVFNGEDFLFYWACPESGSFSRKMCFFECNWQKLWKNTDFSYNGAFWSFLRLPQGPGNHVRWWFYSI